MSNFADFFSKEDFDKFFGKQIQKDAYNSHITSNILRVLDKATNYDDCLFCFVEFLKDLNNKNHLNKISGIEGHLIPKAIFWNKFVETKTLPNKPTYSDDDDCDDENDDDYTAFHLFYQLFRTLIVDLVRKNKDKEPTYEEIVEIINAGNYASKDWKTHIEWYCEGDNHIYCLNFENWQNFKLTRFCSILNDFKEISPIAPQKIEHLEIEFKTGNLIITDWFYKNQIFDEYCKKIKKEWAKISVNSAIGRVNATNLYWKKLGIIHVNVSNTSPDVFESNGNIVVADCSNIFDDYDYETKELYQEAIKDLKEKKLGHVSTGLWWITIIEKEKLIEIMGSEEIYNLYREDEDDFVDVKIEPGKYHLYFTGCGEKFNGLIKNTSLEEKNLKPYFIISKEKIKCFQNMI
jgi:hypothetical protein